MIRNSLGLLFIVYCGVVALECTQYNISRYCLSMHLISCNIPAIVIRIVKRDQQLQYPSNISLPDFYRK